MSNFLNVLELFTDMLCFKFFKSAGIVYRHALFEKILSAGIVYRHDSVSNFLNVLERLSLSLYIYIHIYIPLWLSPNIRRADGIIIGMIWEFIIAIDYGLLYIMT